MVRHALEHGVVLVTAGSYGNAIRVLLPLVITDEQMDGALDVIEMAVRSVGSVAAAAKSPAAAG